MVTAITDLALYCENVPDTGISCWLTFTPVIEYVDHGYLYIDYGCTGSFTKLSDVIGGKTFLTGEYTIGYALNGYDCATVKLSAIGDDGIEVFSNEVVYGELPPEPEPEPEPEPGGDIGGLWLVAILGFGVLIIMVASSQD